MSAFSLDFVLGFFAPIGGALSDWDDLEILLARIGLPVHLTQGQAETLQGLIALDTAIRDLISAGEALADTDPIEAADLAPLVAAAFDLLLDVRALVTTVTTNDLAQLCVSFIACDAERAVHLQAKWRTAKFKATKPC